MRTASTGAIPAALAIVLAAAPAFATNGYFSPGYGTQSIGLEMDQWDLEIGWSFGIGR